MPVLPVGGCAGGGGCRRRGGAGFAGSVMARGHPILGTSARGDARSASGASSPRLHHRAVTRSGAVVSARNDFDRRRPRDSTARFPTSTGTSSRGHRCTTCSRRRAAGSPASGSATPTRRAWCWSRASRGRRRTSSCSSRCSRRRAIASSRSTSQGTTGRSTPARRTSIRRASSTTTGCSSTISSRSSRTGGPPRTSSATASRASSPNSRSSSARTSSRA